MIAVPLGPKAAHAGMRAIPGRLVRPEMARSQDDWPGGRQCEPRTIGPAGDSANRGRLARREMGGSSVQPLALTLMSRGQTYSYLRATTGSTRTALRAGMKAAAMAVSTMTRGATV